MANNTEIDELAHAIAGAGGGALSMIVTYPLVTISTLAQTKQKRQEQRLKDKAAGKPVNEDDNYDTNIIKFVQKNGILKLYSGLESALYGITLTNFIYYYFYEWSTKFFISRRPKHSQQRGLTTIQSIIVGAIAGIFTCIGSNPFWVANTRMMTDKSNESKSTLATLLHIVETDGVGTLFAGVFPALVLVINPIIQYTIFEQIKNVLIKRGNKFTAGNAFFIGAFGKLIATSLTYPYITLKARMHLKRKDEKEKQEIEGKKEESMVQQILTIVREEGIEGLYGGLTIKLIQSITTAAFLFYFKEELLSGSVRLVEIFKLLKLKNNGKK
ncbi:mitochondrial carrier domain-containing protein [Scheffersomyces amazonensis]|uniref:mitochondrial carrier domain-containing protein n=1 Tax=Scheffersomyces amazonensis TaxID=1078765 RepID=UPI00315CF451